MSGWETKAYLSMQLAGLPHPLLHLMMMDVFRLAPSQKFPFGEGQENAVLQLCASAVLLETVSTNNLHTSWMTT